MVDALKNFMSTITDAIMQQVCEQVKKAVKAASSVRPLPRFEHVPIGGYEPSRATLQHLPAIVRGYKKPLSMVENSGLRGTIMVVPLGPMPTLTIAQVMGTQQSQPLPPRPMRHTLEEQPGSKSKNNPRAPREEPLNGNELPSAVWASSTPGDHPMLKRPPPMTSSPQPQYARKYYEFHEQNGHTTTECRELRKALHELADKGQID
ncbi:LOW QUALITY PROTEIN: hypothetical protein Cgig2_025024 [Carnegiea gigantea]|uniref:Uncharacterized protein n=1 Tax=Carnegiea gigantea TaxID=171969 RepID=A0A9Q1K197_9CARY|nr:LOW QUALITY PROTEIN: hypothetical protein Cgig2_025024 [Carnegiea gigantea]